MIHQVLAKNSWKYNYRLIIDRLDTLISRNFCRLFTKLKHWFIRRSRCPNFKFRVQQKRRSSGKFTWKRRNSFTWNHHEIEIYKIFNSIHDFSRIGDSPSWTWFEAKWVQNCWVRIGSFGSGKFFSKVQLAQCWNFMIFLSLWISVKSLLWILEVHNLSF